VVWPRLVGRWLLPRPKRAAPMKMISKTSMTSERRDIHAVHFPKLVSAVVESYCHVDNRGQGTGQLRPPCPPAPTARRQQRTKFTPRPAGRCRAWRPIRTCQGWRDRGRGSQASSPGPVARLVQAAVPRGDSLAVLCGWCALASQCRPWRALRPAKVPSP
jgi:hypothetical protein